MWLVSDHPYFVAVQFHPEYISRPMKPSPPYLGLLLASCGRLQNFANRGFRLSPRLSYSEDDLSDDDELVDLSSNMSSATLSNSEGNESLP